MLINPSVFDLSTACHHHGLLLCAAPIRLKVVVQWFNFLVSSIGMWDYNNQCSVEVQLGVGGVLSPQGSVSGDAALSLIHI